MIHRCDIFVLKIYFNSAGNNVSYESPSRSISFIEIWYFVLSGKEFFFPSARKKWEGPNNFLLLGSNKRYNIHTWYLIHISTKTIQHFCANLKRCLNISEAPSPLILIVVSLLSISRKPLLSPSTLRNIFNVIAKQHGLDTGWKLKFAYI